MDDSRLSQGDGYVIKSIDLDELKQKVGDIPLNDSTTRPTAERTRGKLRGGVSVQWDNFWEEFSVPAWLVSRELDGEDFLQGYNYEFTFTKLLCNRHHFVTEAWYKGGKAQG